MMRPLFVVLDRDGTIIVERHYLRDPTEVELLPGAAIGLRHLRELGLGLAVITNQSAVGRGLIDRNRLERIHQRMRGLLKDEGVHLEGLYVCPHLAEERCSCRKPATGLLRLAALELGFEPRRTFVIGDKASDIEMGRRVDATTLLVRTGYGREYPADEGASPDYTVDDLQGAATIIEGILQGKHKRF